MKPSRSCELIVDGASRGNPGPAGIGVVVLEGQPEPAHRLAKFLGETTNNVAEYLALIYGVQWALHAGYTRVGIKTDSELLVRQIHGRYQVRDATLRLFSDIAKHLLAQLAHWSLEHTPRAHTVLADRLAAGAAKRRAPEALAPVL